MQNTPNIVQITDRSLIDEWIAEFNLDTREVVWRNIPFVATLSESVKKHHEETWKNSIKKTL